MLYNPGCSRAPLPRRRPYDALIREVFLVSDEADEAMIELWCNLCRSSPHLGRGDRRIILESAVKKLLSRLPPVLPPGL
jgi:hypothetical protein